jgi:predicted dehydrogenase
MRVGVVGCGYWGEKHVRVLSQMTDISVVVHDPVERRSSIVHADYGASVATSFESLLSMCDAVVIATPASTHHPLARTALRYGRHVLVEKPFTTTVADARDLAELAERKGLVLAVGHTFLYHPAVRALQDLVGRGSLGDVRYLQSWRLNLGTFQPDVNVIWDLAPHDVSIMDAVLGMAPTGIRAFGSNHAGGPCADTAHLAFEYAGSRVSSYVSVGWLHPTKVRKLVVVGSTATAVFDDLAEERLTIHASSAHVLSDAETAGRAIYTLGDVRPVPLEAIEPLAEEDADFVRCIQEGFRPRNDARAAISVVGALEAASRALGQASAAEANEATAGVPARFASGLRY